MENKDMELLTKYFPDLTPLQIERFAQLYDLYSYWNERINVVSRKDMDHLCLHHVLHSLAIAKVCSFHPRARIIDVGTGGGFPGIPLAIMFPEAQFTLVDSIGKKIKVVEEVVKAIRLENVTAVHGRAEQTNGKFDFAVSRAVTEMKTLLEWAWNKLEPHKRHNQNHQLSNGILCLKGGDLTDELATTGKQYTLYNISDFFDEDFFITKKIVYIPR